MFFWERYNLLYLFISATHVHKSHKCRSWHYADPQCSPLLFANVAVSPWHGLFVVSLTCQQIFIILDKINIKPYLHQTWTEIRHLRHPAKLSNNLSIPKKKNNSFFAKNLAINQINQILTHNYANKCY